MLSFLQYLRESLADPSPVKSKQPFELGSLWYNSKTGQHTAIDPSGSRGQPDSGLQSATYHAGFVVKNPEHFGVTTQELHDAILKFENPKHPDFQTPEGQKRLAEKRIGQLASGYSDTHPGVDSLVMSKGWVRVSRTPSTMYVQGKAPALFRLAKQVHHFHPDITSLSMDVHGAAETYGHLDPSIHGMAHTLVDRDTIQDFVERSGAPHPSYTRIVRRSDAS
jgi:hypothetical protein